MGMHFGIIGVKSTWQSVLDELSDLFGKFVDKGPVSSVTTVPFAKNEDGIVVGEQDNCAFIYDRSMVLSADHDRLLEISRRLDTLLVACVGETVSGTFGLFVADKGKVSRLYWNCNLALSKPFTEGNNIPCEAERPLEDIDGAGLLGAMAYLGMDFSKWNTLGAKFAYLWDFTNSKSKNTFAPNANRPISLALSQHHKQFGIPKENLPKPKVVMRRMPDGSTGYDIVSKPVNSSQTVFSNQSKTVAKTGSFWKRIWSRVRGR
jgi:hypothetical protein